MIYYESPEARVSYNEEIKAVVIEWKKFAQGEKYRTPMEKARELTAQKKSKKWLYDSRQLPVISREDQEWNSRDFHPRNIEAGMRYLATIRPQKVLGASSLKKVVSNAVETVEFTHREFDSVEEAMKWLAEQDGYCS